MSGKLVPQDYGSEDIANDLKFEIAEVFDEWETVKEGGSEKGIRRHDGEQTRPTRFSKEPIRSLVELVSLQKAEIEYLMKFGRDWEQIEAHYPDRLEDLLTASLFPIFRPEFAAKLRAVRVPQNWEHKRQRYKLPSGVGLIEYEFGGAGEAEWRKTSLYHLLGLPYQPTCLDKIFEGGAVKMHKSDGEPGLQDWFGMHRNRLPKNLQGQKEGREKRYDYLDVVKVMHSLLSEESRKKRKQRGRSPRKPWLNNREKRIHVLTGIVARMDSLSVSQDVWDAFTVLVCYHVMNGRPQREDINQWLGPLVRRYLLDSGKK